MDRRLFVAAVSATACFYPRPVKAQCSEDELDRVEALARYGSAMQTMARMLDWGTNETAEVLLSKDYLNEDWRMDLVAPFAIADAVVEISRSIQPPEELTESYDLFIEGVESLVRAGDEIRKWVLTSDPARMDAALAYLAKWSELSDASIAAIPPEFNTPE
jgi:hypothetical protein